MSFVVKAVKQVVSTVSRVVSSVVKGVVSVVSSIAKIAIPSIPASAMNFVEQPFMSGAASATPAAAPVAQEVERQQGVLVQLEGSNINIPVVYGYRKVGGIVTFAETGSTNNRYLYVAYVFSEGLVEGLREVFIDDWLLPVNLTGNLNAGQVVDIDSDRYSGRVRLQWSPGAYFNNPASSPVGASVKSGIFAEAPSFTNRMNYNGLAVLFARYEWKEIKTQEDADNNPFRGNIPQVQVAMLGRRVASLQVAAEGFAYDSAPVRYSTNPAEILLDYLRNPRYGKGLKNNDIDWLSFKKAASKCNTRVTYLNTTGDITGPIMTCNYVLDTGQTIFNNVKVLLAGFRAYMPYVQGLYKLRIEDAGNEDDILSGAATITMTAQTTPYLKNTFVGNVCDIVGEISYTGIEKSNKYNVVNISYVDPDQKFSVQEVIFPETAQERQQYIDIDGGRENKLTMAFPTLTNYAMAKDMARLLFNKGRRQETITLTLSSEAIELEPGDNIRIQSNILNFGDIPWRIITLRINDDMTVTVSCVKNPDDMYPYSRVGEEDIVLAVYVPKGSIIYYPGSSNYTLLGLIPPTNAVYPINTIPNPVNPGPTNPGGIGGGGVGSTPGGDTTNPVNNNPTPVPPPPPFSAVLRLKRSSGTDLKNGTFLYNLVFEMPGDGLYSFSTLWWRPNRFSPWIEVRKDDKPAVGGEITFALGPLPPGVLEFYVRSYAVDGRASINVTQGVATIRANSAELNPALTGIATANTVQVTDGWTLPGQEIPPVPRYDDAIGLINISTKTSGGFPLATRRLSVSFQQITNILSGVINPLIDGVRIYYKQREEIYYAYEDFKFSAFGQYFPGQVLNFDLAGDFGARTYPSPIIANTLSAAQQRYTFVVRLLYSDGKPAEQQFGPVNGVVEQNSFGEYQFKVVGTDPYATGTSLSQPIPTGFNDTFKTVDQDPNATAPSGIELTPSINRIFASRFENKITFQFNPPTTNISTFRGYAIRYRAVVAGTNPEFIEVLVPPVTGVDGKITYEIVANGFALNTTIEWVISNQVKGSAGILNGTTSLAGRASIPRDLFEDNIYNRFSFVLKNTEEALGLLKTAFPATPVVNPKSWIKRQVEPFVSGSTKFISGTLQVTKTSAGFPLNIYMKFRFQAPASGYTHIVCYRRVFDSRGIQRTTVTTVPKYAELGPWEKVRVALADLPTDAEGFKTINVRGPLDPNIIDGYFNRYYQISGQPTTALLVDPRWGATGQFPSANGYAKSTGIFPMWREGVGNYSTPEYRRAEYLWVLDNAGTEQTVGLMLTDFYSPQVAGLEYVTDADGFISQYGNVKRDEVIADVGVFNTIEAGFGRRLSEAVTAAALDKMFIPGTNANSPGAAPPGFATWTSTTRTLPMLPPTTGDTVY